MKDQILKLVDLLDDNDWEVRRDVVKALGEMGTAAKDQIPRIVAFLDDADWRVRVRAVEALGRIGEASREEIPGIMDLLQKDLFQQKALKVPEARPTLKV